MNPFIPEEDKESFEKYLTDNDLEPATDAKASRSSPTQSRGNNKREGGSHVPNIDKFLHDIDSQMDNVLEGTTNF